MATKDSEQKNSLRKKNQKDSSEGQKPNKWKRKNLSLLIFLVLALLILMRIMGMKHHEEDISYSKFKQIMASEDFPFEKLILKRNGEGYSLTASTTISQEEVPEVDGKANAFAPITKTIKVQLPFSDEVHNQIEEWDKKGIEIEFDKETAWMGWIGSILPLILIIAFVWFMMSRQSQAGGGPRGIFSFGKSNARLSDSEKPEVTFVDIAGCDEAKQDLQEIKEFLQDPTKFSKLGGKIPKGILLLGPPGTGKTLLARAVAGEAEVPFFSMSGSDFVEMFVGVGASRVRDLFEQGKKNSPCIIFIDEIDAVGRHRGAGLGGGHDEREQTLNQLLVEMDGFNQNDGVILLAATNRPDVLDPALLRPGRFDRQIVVDAPDVKGRAGILDVHLKKRKVPTSDDVDVSKIAKATPGLVGADLENLVNEACLLAARFGSKKVGMIDFEEAKDKIMIGTERVSRIITPEEKKTTAYHEAGHALITTLMKHADPLHKITIIPRGRSLGVTFSLPEKDQYTMSSKYILDKIAILMGGREAELLLFNQKNTGASNDIRVATDLARKYVCEWGMSDNLGPLSYGKKQEEIFLGKEISQHRDFSEATAVEIDKEVSKMIFDQSTRVKKLLTEHKQELINLAEALLNHENLEGEEITQAIKGETIDAPKKSRSFIRFKTMSEEVKSKKEAEESKESSDSSNLDTHAAKVSETGLAGNKKDNDKDSGRGLNVDTSA